MLQTLKKTTNALKHSLIKLGYALPPPCSIHNNKLKQVSIDFKQMSNVLIGTYNDTLFENATAVLFECTSTYYLIQSLPELVAATIESNRYVSSY